MGDTRRLGVTLAAATALISGVSVFVNGLAVQAWAGAADPTTYTTVKNAIAAALLVGVGLVGARRGWSDGWRRPTSRRQWWGLGAVAVVGGSVPFVLFFEGLARSESLQAALLHKSLVIWVAILAVGLLGERLGPWHWLAIGAVVIGQVLYAGGVTDVAFG
ncbi:MAG: DMT family transporter, partial [Acidimicrobiia bacterium]